MMILNLISGSGCGIEKIFPKDGMGGGLTLSEVLRKNYHFIFDVALNMDEDRPFSLLINQIRMFS